MAWSASTGSRSPSGAAAVFRPPRRRQPLGEGPAEQRLAVALGEVREEGVEPLLLPGDQVDQRVAGAHQRVELRHERRQGRAGGIGGAGGGHRRGSIAGPAGPGRPASYARVDGRSRSHAAGRPAPPRPRCRAAPRRRGRAGQRHGLGQLRVVADQRRAVAERRARAPAAAGRRGAAGEARLLLDRRAGGLGQEAGGLAGARERAGDGCAVTRSLAGQRPAPRAAKAPRARRP